MENKSDCIGEVNNAVDLFKDFHLEDGMEVCVKFLQSQKETDDQGI